MFGSVFRFSHLKTAVFRFWGLPRFAGFLEVFFGFRFSSTMMTVFRIFLSSAFYGFSGFAKEVTPRSRAKTGVIPRDHMYSVLPFLSKAMDDKPSLFSSRYLSRNGKVQDNIKTKDYFANITRLE